MSEAIWGVTSGLKTMADDTVRITVDIDPKYFDQACSQFGKRGVEVALAQLQQGATVDYEQKEPPKPKGGKLSVLSAMFCKQPEFWDYFGKFLGTTIANEEACVYRLKQHLVIGSRAEIDNNPSVFTQFDQIRKDYVAWQQTIDLAG